MRYIYQVLREAPPEQVFAQTLLGFETVQASMDAHEPSWVGINFVLPEDGFISMRDYTLQMKMLEYLHSVYPKVHISLHAGELAPGLVPPEGLRFHIRQAVELGHAERIGHGVDVMYEDDAAGLLKEMAQKHVMVEINLSSNEGILGVKGAEHPFPLYRAAHVPVALSTDDEGVSRIDITQRIRARRAGLPPELSGSEAVGPHRHGAQLSSRREPVGRARRLHHAGGSVQRADAWARASPRQAARAFSTAAKRPPRSGSWSGASARSRRSSELFP